MGTLFCQVTKPSVLISPTSAKKNIFRKIPQTSFEKFCKHLSKNSHTPRPRSPHRSVLRNRVFWKIVTHPVTGKMKFCKICHKRVVEAVSTTKDFTKVCLCGDGYLRVGGSEAVGFLGVIATSRNRKVRKDFYVESYHIWRAKKKKDNISKRIHYFA